MTSINIIFLIGERPTSGHATEFGRTHTARPVVPNLWFAYPWGYAKIILVIAKKKRVKIKTRKQSYQVLVYKERLK
jgi:hypothetical protein